MNNNLPIADIHFVLVHKKTNTEIKMPVLSICEEYSGIIFSTKQSDYNGEFNGIGRLPSYVGDDTCREYDVFIYINGVFHKYNGLMYSPKKELLQDAEYDKGGFVGRKWNDKF